MSGNLTAQPSLSADLGESAIAVVSEQKIHPDVSNQNIRVPVIVYVGYRYPGTPVWVGKPAWAVTS
jgi:hypothetical protein